jgi:hypothetical protein
MWAGCSMIKHDAAKRIRERWVLAAGGLLMGCVTMVAGCGGGTERDEPDPDPLAAVRDAAVKTLAAGPATIGIGVSSATVGYSVRGTIDMATDRFRVRARVKRAPMTHFGGVIEVIGVGGETYEIGSGEPGFDNITPTACAFDPHAPIGSLGGAASIQEAVALVGVALRLVRDGSRKATVAEEQAGGSATYRVVIDPSTASAGPGARGGDEVIVVDPPRLARHLAPVRVSVDSDGLVRRLSLELRRFPPPSHGPGLVRERRRERVSIAVSLTDHGRELDVSPPACIAME